MRLSEWVYELKTNFMGQTVQVIGTKFNGLQDQDYSFVYGTKIVGQDQNLQVYETKCIGL